MAILFMDPVGGNDANNGTTFALRFKTFNTGATAARIAPGDVIRIMKSPDPTLVDSSGSSWTNNSKTVTLSAAVTQTIDNCETAWTASANVTVTADTATYKQGTKSAKLVFASGFTTGLAAYFALPSTLDLSSYQQVSFWLNIGSVVAGTFSLRLCSDAAGATTVNTLAIPAGVGTANKWMRVTVDTGAALGNSINSVALYCDTDPATATIQLDNIIACKASSDADALTLHSLIGKEHNLSWTASTSYAANKIRRPTQPNRNGYIYKVTAGGGGSSGSSEPAWPEEVGLTVSDGALTWTCLDLEDTWYAIQSIDGATVLIDNISSTLGNAGRGYPRDTETVPLYQRRLIVLPGVASTSTTHNSTNEAGTQTAPIEYSGGWNTSDMTTQDGETWIASANGFGTAIYLGHNFNKLINFSMVSFTNGILTGGIMPWLSNVSVTSCEQSIDQLFDTYDPFVKNFHCVCGSVATFAQANFASVLGGIYERIQSHTNILGPGIMFPEAARKIDIIHCYYNYDYGINAWCAEPIMNNFHTRSNGSGSLRLNKSGSGMESFYQLKLFNALLEESTKFASPLGGARRSNQGADRISSIRHGRVDDAHLIWIDDNSTYASCSTIESATDRTHGAGTIAWKFKLRSTAGFHGNWNKAVRLPVARVQVNANAAVTARIWANRDNTNIKGRFILQGGQILGAPVDIIAAMEPSVDTWTQYTITFTPTVKGVVEICVDVMDAVGNTNNYWIDDFSVTQA